MAVQIQMRRDTADNWETNDPTLAAGEWGLETDTLKFKIGTGSATWENLAYSSLPSGTATLASPTFTGVPAAPTAAANTSTTQIATTAFVMTELGDYALLANPTFTGTPDAPTAAANTSTTQLATTAFVMTEVGDYLPLTGGTLAGVTLSGAVVGADQIISAPVLKDIGETCVTNATSGATDTISLTDGNVHNVTLTADCTFTFAAPPASGTSGSFTLFLNQDGTGSRTATWPGSVKWAGGTAPTLTTTASRTDILVFTTIDAGTIWYGAVSGQDFS